jgi:hypothetical protein
MIYHALQTVSSIVLDPGAAIIGLDGGMYFTIGAWTPQNGRLDAARWPCTCARHIA